MGLSAGHSMWPMIAHCVLSSSGTRKSSQSTRSALEAPPGTVTRFFGPNGSGKFSPRIVQRLGIMATLLGDPEVLLFDEPVNGLDPDGIRWVRNLLKGLAREGRTVFVSSHLMSEMALAADEVVIIAKGRVIAEDPADELISQSSQRFVRVRSPEVDKLRIGFETNGATNVIEEDGSLSVRGVDEVAIGELAASLPMVLDELSPQSASLEDAFRELTGETVEYHGAAIANATASGGIDR